MATRLTKNFTLEEFGLSKDSPALYVKNATDMVIGLLQPLRDYLGQPIYIPSGWRSEKHNKEVGGVPDSQHLIAQAADIKSPGVDPVALSLIIRERFDWDVMILYAKGAKGYPNGGVHVSFVKGKNRRIFKTKEA